MGLVDEMLQHLLGHREVGNHTVLQRPDSLDVARRAPEHALCGLADRCNALATAVAVPLPYGYYRRFVEHDARSTGIHQSVRSAEVNGEVIGEQTSETLEHERSDSQSRLPAARIAQYNRVSALPGGRRRSPRLAATRQFSKRLRSKQPDCNSTVSTLSSILGS